MIIYQVGRILEHLTSSNTSHMYQNVNNDVSNNVESSRTQFSLETLRIVIAIANGQPSYYRTMKRLFAPAVVQRLIQIDYDPYHELLTS